MMVFLFTDIEGSTRLWEEHSDEMGACIARHDAILKQRIELRGGRITKHTGDGVTAAFEEGEPLTCALETQVQFAREQWGAIGELRIRMGLHAGAAKLIGGAEWPAAPGLSDGDYFGPTVNCTARIMSAAWGGQILVTPEVMALCDLPPQAALVDLGEHLLKDVSLPQRIYQLTHPDLRRQEFPPVRTLSGEGIRQMLGQQGERLMSLEPSAIAVGLASAALMPTLQGDPDPSSPAWAGNLGVLGDLGAVALRCFLVEFAERLRSKQAARQAPLPSEIQAHLEYELLQRWEAGGESAAALRADVSRLLQAVRGVEAIMSASTADLREVLVQGLAELGGTFREFRWMLGGLRETLDEMRVEMRALQKEQLDLQRQHLEKTELLLRIQQEQMPDSQLEPEVATTAAKPQVAHNLPAQLTPLVGRSMQLAEVRAELARPEVRLLTLTGTGGTGKTRLALQVARELLEQAESPFEDGVFFVPLAPVRDPGLVLSAIAGTLDVREAGDRPLLETLKDRLRDKKLLLILDSFEHVGTAGPMVTDLLADAPHLRVLVTSRALMGVYGEYSYFVPPLARPDPRELPSVERLACCESIQLFLQRAQAVRSQFRLTADNAQAVAGICDRLEGLPLAIELAARRIRLLPPEKILAQLGSRLRLLTGGARDLADRHQTLRAAIDWSYDLLSAGEQTLFRQLAVFYGSFTLEAAEAVCNPCGDLDVLCGLGALVDQSLLNPTDAFGEPRFTMLETIREYALEQLAAVGIGEAAEARRLHAAFFLALAEEAEPHLVFTGAQQATWLRRLRIEHDNLRSALAWSLEGASTDEWAAEAGLRLAGALGWFWYMCGHLREGRQWLQRALNSALGPQEVLAKALTMSGAMAWQQGDYGEARDRLTKGVARWREVGCQAGLAEGLHCFGHLALDEGEHAEARALFQESLDIYRELDDSHLSMVLLQDLGLLAYHQGAFDDARAQFEAGLATSRALGQKDIEALALNRLGELARLRDDDEKAALLFEESLAVCREIGANLEQGGLLKNLGHMAKRRGDHTGARTLFNESLTLQLEYGNKQGMAESLAGLASVASDPECAARLFGVVEALLDAAGLPLSPADRADYDRNVAAVRVDMGKEAFAAAQAKGRAMAADAADEAWEQIIACALAGVQP